MVELREKKQEIKTDFYTPRFINDTGQRWADKSSTDVTSTDELVANEQPTDTTGNVSPNGHDQDQIVDIDETLDFDYDTNDDPYDFEYMNTAPFSGLLNR